MNLRAQMLVAAALLIASISLWRQFSLEDELDSLRAELRARPTPAPAIARSPEPAPILVSERDNGGLAELERRVSELEDVASETARIVNSELDEKEARIAALPKAAWSAAQVTGEPDTLTAGDQRTAWAPAGQDSGEEWIEVTFPAEVRAANVLVRETFNPGAISKVSLILDNGSEMPIWQGTQAIVAGPIERLFPVGGDVGAQKVKVYLDTKRAPGWNEIDAIALIDRAGRKHWAKSANASSSYGGNGPIWPLDLGGTVIDGGSLRGFQGLSEQGAR